MNTRYPLVALNIIIVFIFFFFCCDAANAQRRSNRGLNYDGDPPGFGGGSYGSDDIAGWGISLHGGFDSPQGDLGASYKGAPLVGLSVLKYYKNFTFGISVSRHSYKPVVDSIGVEINMGDIYSYSQTIKLTNNRFTGIYASAAYNIGLAQGFKCYGGVNFGGMTSKYGVSVSGTEGNYSESYTDKYGYFAPKLGVDVAISNGFSIGVEGKYNIFIQGGNSRTDEEAIGTVKSVAGAATLTYSF